MYTMLALAERAVNVCKDCGGIKRDTKHTCAPIVAVIETEYDGEGIPYAESFSEYMRRTR